MLQQLGLSAHLESLPGWGCLFYLAEHHVYLLHKSLSDWLLDARSSGVHAVDVGAGHRVLGKSLSRDLEAAMRAAATADDESRVTSSSGLDEAAALAPERLPGVPPSPATQQLLLHLSAYAVKYTVLHLARGGQPVAPLLDLGGWVGGWVEEGTGPTSSCHVIMMGPTAGGVGCLLLPLAGGQ